MPFQRTLNILEKVANIFNMKISTTKTKTMTFKGKPHLMCKIIIGKGKAIPVTGSEGP
jgi:hypothetical protein